MTTVNGKTYLSLRTFLLTIALMVSTYMILNYDNNTISSKMPKPMQLIRTEIADEFNGDINSVNEYGTLSLTTQNEDSDKAYIENNSNLDNMKQKEKLLDEIWLKKMEDRFERRSMRVKDECKKIKPDAITSKAAGGLMAPKYNLLVCAVFKAGSSTWRSHMEKLNEEEQKTGPHQDHGHYDRQELYHLPRVNSSMHSPSPYVRVMNTRHPLARLVSAYINKYRNGTTVNERGFIELAEKHLNITSEKKSNRKFIENISFNDFLNIVLGNTANFSIMGENWNNHWKPVHLICSPCQRNYEYIMKVETFSEDIAFIFRKLGLTHLNAEVQENKKSLITDHGKAEYETYYQNISNDILWKIHQIYKEDYKLFGYDIPDFVKRVL